MTSKLSHIRADDLSIFQNALATYLAEVAPDADLSATPIATRALSEPDHISLWILQDDTRIGFAILRQTATNSRQLREFTIFPPHRLKHLGRDAAHLLFATYPGAWSLGVAANSPHAGAFWRATLNTLPGASGLRELAPELPTQSHKLAFTMLGDSNAA
ncbi:hypothetical protein ACS3QZ_11725 [Shimia sp. W99]